MSVRTGLTAKAREIAPSPAGEDSELDAYMDDDSEGDSGCDEDETVDPPPQRLAMVVMMCMIGGYTLIGPLQHDIKEALGVADCGPEGEVFTQSVAMVQWVKTFMTLGQNVLFAYFTTMTRVYISMVFMFFGTLIPPLFFFTLGVKSLSLVAISYGTIGCSLGMFEGSYLSVISPLGPMTKSWAIMGFPAAFGLINVVGRLSMVYLNMPVELLFWCIVVGIPIAMLVFDHIAPEDTTSDGKSYKQAGVRASLRDWRSWFIKMIPFLMVNIVAHFVMESVLPAIFNTYNAKKVSIYGPQDVDNLMDKNMFLVILAIFNMAGDMISRRVGYCFELKRYRTNFAALLFSLSCCFMGLYLVTLGVAWLSWISVFLAFWGNGFNYAVTAKYIDKFVPRKHNLAAYSLWMFVGYSGAIAGAVLVNTVKSQICRGENYAYQCTYHHHCR